MKDKQLYKILDNHKLWVDSEGEEGEKANLEGANLEGANLEGASLEEANLHFAVLKCVNLECADLFSANLECADLSGAVLSGVDLRGANLKGAKFTTEIREVRLLQFCDITKDQLAWLVLHPQFSEFYPTLRVS